MSEGVALPSQSRSDKLAMAALRRLFRFIGPEMYLFETDRPLAEEESLSLPSGIPMPNTPGSPLAIRTFRSDIVDEVVGLRTGRSD